MNESTWNPSPGDRVLIHNAGEYGHCYEDQVEVDYLKHQPENNHLAQVYDGIHVGEFTVLRSDLSPVEPPVADWRDIAGLVDYEGLGDLRRAEERTCPTCGQKLTPRSHSFAEQYEVTFGTPFEPWIGPGTEETRRFTKEDYDDIERARKEAIVSEWLVEQLELIGPKLAESYRARTRKEKGFSQSTDRER